MGTNSNGKNPQATSELKERIVFPKPKNTMIAGGVLHNVFVLKFREGSHIRVQKSTFIFDESLISPAEEKLLERANLNRDTIKEEVNRVNDLFFRDPDLQFQPMFSQPETDLDREKFEGEQLSGEELADLNLYFYVFAKKIAFQETAQIIDQLNALSVVELAYPQPIPFPASVDILPRTGEFTGLQSYLEPAPEGIDAYYAWAFRGGRGENAQLIDIETGWHLDHEDLPPERSLFHNHGWNLAIFTDHGTAVLGILAAQDNAYGITGIVPEVSLGVDSPVAAIPPYDVPGAINRTARVMNRGGIILIEQHYPFGRDGRWVPVENSQGDFDAIRTATARGMIVVEAAGNGGEDLDLPYYEGRFNRGVRDSQAILVGAGGPYTGIPQDFSNFGSRVDVQGWGSSVMTTGYGNMVPGAGGDARQRYTKGFDGTSSASPIVAGAAAAIHSIRVAHGLPILTSVQMRDLLRDTGTPQPSSTRQIGPLPDLRRAIDSIALASLPGAGWPDFSDFQSDSAPVIVQRNSGALTCFVIRASQLWWRTQSEPYHEWGNWLQLGDQALVGRPAALLRRDGCLEVFARGRDHAIWHTAQLFPDAGSAWSGWQALDGSYSGDPTIAINPDGQLEVFVRGLNDQLWTVWQQSINGPWESGRPITEGRLASKAAIARQTDGSLTLFARLKDNTVRYLTRDPSRTWSGWQHAGGLTRGTPVLATNADGRLEVFVRGLDDALWHMWQNPGGGWSNWSSLGGNLARNSNPTVGLSPFGNLIAFVRWNDNTVRHIWQVPDPPYWSTWDVSGDDIGGNINSDLTVSFHTDGRFDLFARAWNGMLVNVSHHL